MTPRPPVQPPHVEVRVLVPGESAPVEPPGLAALPWWRRWRTTLLAAFLLVSLATAAAEAVRVARDYRDARQSALARQSATARLLATAVETLVLRYVGVAQVTAHAVFDGRLAPSARHRLLASVRQMHPEIDGVIVLDPAGRVVDADAEVASLVGQDLSDRAYFQQVRAGASLVVSDLVLSRASGAPSFAMASAPRDREGRLRGAVVLGLRAAAVERDLTFRLHDGAFPVVVDRSGRVIVHGAFPDLEWEARDFSGVPAVAEALAGRPGLWTGFLGPPSGRPQVGALVPLRSLGWAVGLLQPADAVMAPVRAEMVVSLGATGLVLGLGVGLALLLGAWLSRPVGALAAGVAALTQGDLSYRVTVAGRNEFGSLAAAFNRMAAALEAARRQEAQLNDELTIANEELQANAVQLEESLAELEVAQRRASFLADASAVLARSLDYETALANAARVAVPELGDWCFLDLDEGTGRTRRVAVAHADPSEAPLADELRRAFFEVAGPHPVARALRTGRGEVVSEVTESWLVAIAPDDAHVARLRRLAPTACLFVPLTARGRTFGAMTFVATRRDRRYHAADLALATELAGRVALAIDNARLYTELNQAQGALRASEEQLRQAQKMEAVGRLAGGVAHDFNNLLTAISGYGELLASRLGEHDPLARDVGEIRKAADRAAALTRQLLAFSRQQVLQPRVLDLNAVVANVEKMLRRVIGEDIELVTLAASGLGHVEADPGQLEQVLLNLVINARDAMPEGGKLTIETANVELDEDYARQHVSVRPGPYVMLAVSDTGCGMDAETRARIFEPFFTTKEYGKGTGLGLSTVYGIVRQSGGNVWVYSEVGRGTTFKVYLPRVEAPLTPSAPAAVAAAVRGTETVLLVEDDAGVRSLAERVLREHGYAVLEARDGDEALRVSQGHQGAIDLVLTDVVMPGTSGPDLVKRLSALRPEARVLFMSGYTDNVVFRQRASDAGTAFLDKPFTPSMLLLKVREVLDARVAP